MLFTLPIAAAVSAPDAYAIYARARSRWASQSYPAFLSYSVRISGVTSGGQEVVNTYGSFDDTLSGEVNVRATSAEEAANPYVPSGVLLKTKMSVGYSRTPHVGNAPSVEGNGDIQVSKTIPVSKREQYDLLGVPLLSPTYSFGLAPAAARPSPTNGLPNALKTIAVVTATRRDYDVRYEGTGAIDGVPCYRLQLTPRGDPGVFRLREVWIDDNTHVTRQVQVQGNFTSGPGPRIPWRIHFTMHGDATYIADETALTPVRYFGRTYHNGRLSLPTLHRPIIVTPCGRSHCSERRATY